MHMDAPLDERKSKRPGSYNARILTMFHEEYAKNPTSRKTRFQRGHVAEWRHILDFIYGSHTIKQIVDAARAESNYTIPHASPMTEDREAYYCFDSVADTYVGKISL